MGLEKLQGQLSNFLSSWSETATGSGSSTVSASHAAESDRAHYICGFVVSADFGAAAPESLEVKLVEGPLIGSTTLMQFTVSGVSQLADQATGAPFSITFANPLKITDDLAIKITVNPSGSAAVKTDANLWGFTS